MNALRSILFNIFFFGGSLVISTCLLFTLLLPRKKCVPLVSEIYGGYITWIEKYIMNLHLEIRGWEHVPKDKPFILAAKHQSAFETLKLPFMKELRYPTIILKKSLSHIPLWGWYTIAMGQVAIDRGSGMDAMNSISRGCQRAIGEGRPVIIFPQGTRVPVSAIVPYKIGLAKVYRDLDVAIVPMALNSGVFWGRNAFFKKSGTVVFEFLPPIPAGLAPLKVMEQLETDIEAATKRLVREAREKDA